MIRRRVAAAVALAIAVSWLAAAPAAAYTTRDMLGRDVTLAAPPKRIV